MPGLKTVETYSPVEIRGPGHISNFLITNCTVEQGQDLDAGQVVGMRPTSRKYIAYNKDANASATSPVPGDDNTGEGSCGAVEVQDDYTLTENWTLTCTAEAENGGTFSVVGSVSGNVGNATVGSEFKYPNTSAYMVKFTIADSGEDFDEGDVFTFSTTAAGATVATGILKENVDATEEDKISGKYVKGIFKTALLTGLDVDAKTHMGAKEDGDYLII